MLVDEDTAKRATKVIQHSDRIILVKIQALLVDIVLIQIYICQQVITRTRI